MGSGCTQPQNSNNCTTITSSHCVIWQGDPVPALGICTGDTLTEVEQVILDRVQDYATGAGVTLPSITSNCDFVKNYLDNADKSLAGFIQNLYDNDCTLRQYIQTLQDGVEPPFAFDVKCLTVPVNANRNEILQATVTRLCTLDAQVQQLVADISTEDPDETTNTILNAVYNIVGNMLGTNIKSCQNNITKIGSGADTILKFTAQVPLGGMIFGNFNASQFDNTGLGVEATGMCGWAIANGNNGTLDMRGWTPAGATNVPGPALLPAVNPGADTDLQTNIGSRKGTSKVTLQASQIPNHEHTLNDPGHNHIVHGIIHQNTPDFGNGGAGLDTWFGDIASDTKTTGITIGGVKGGSGQAHENRQPTLYAMFIQRIA